MKAKTTYFSLLSTFAVVLVVGLMMGYVPLRAEDAPGFFRFPSTDGKWVAFTSEGDLWRVPLDGGVAYRLTAQVGEERFAHYSPDGQWITYSAQDDSQFDVFVLQAAGGEPRRLTYHPDYDYAMGWTPQGEVLFRSRRESNIFGYKMYKINAAGGYPEALPLDQCALISYEPNGKRVAINRYSREFRTWKRYKGGWAQDVWVGDFDSFKFTNITDNPGVNNWDGTDAFPMWHTDGRIYFLSDRDGRSNIYSMLPDGRDCKQHTFHKNFDARWASLGNGVIVYQLGMDIRAYDVGSGTDSQVKITLPTDRIQARTKFVEPSQFITDYDLSPDGGRLLLSARGELFTAPTKGKGLIRQLTFSSSSREKNPVWTSDGKEIIYWSDDTGEEMLYRMPAEGGAATRLGSDGEGWHYPPAPSPDGKWVAFTNEELNLIVMKLDSPDKLWVVDKGNWEIRDYVWSADSRWLAYSRPEENYNNTIRIADVKEHEVHVLTDDFTHSFSPSFDPKGKYLYFLSDRNYNPHLDGMEMSYILDKRSMLFLVPLTKDVVSPFAPEADPKEEEEKPWEKDKNKDDNEKKEDKDKPVKVEIDFDRLTSRIVAFPAAPGNYFALQAVKNKVFYLSRENNGMFGKSEFEEDSDQGLKLNRFDIKKKEAKTVTEKIRGYDISGNGEKLLIWKEGQFTVQGIDEDGGGDWKPDKDEKNDKNVDLSQWDLRVDVRAEWRQIFKEAWRFERDFFWDPNLHKVNWDEVYAKYAPLAQRISTRDELNDLIGEMIAELNCSHTYVWGGDMERPKAHPTGLLGCDLSRDASGFYRIDRIYPGLSWVEGASSPLSAPGLKAQEGNYIIAVNGQPVNDHPNIWELFLNKADKIINLTLNDKPQRDGGWDVVIKPLEQEWALRYDTWVLDRREYINKRSDGRIGYIHLTDMGGSGLSQFTEGYLPQHRKPALIMDVRNNGGGFVAEMILAHLNRQLVSVGRPRHGSTYRSPQTAFYGYMAAVCNGQTGSDGETFTEGFKRLELGPVIGTRTWGGWVGIRMDKPLMDRGALSQPEFTGWGLDGKYLIEGWGTDPDIEVKENPASQHLGIDPQLDAAIDYLLKKIEQEPKLLPEPPAFPDRSGFAR